MTEENYPDYVDYAQIEQELIEWGEMMARQEQDELNNPDPMLDDYRGVQ